MSRRGWALLFCVTPRVCLAGRRVRFRSLLREMETHCRSPRISSRKFSIFSNLNIQIKPPKWIQSYKRWFMISDPRFSLGIRHVSVNISTRYYLQAHLEMGGGTKMHSILAQTLVPTRHTPVFTLVIGTNVCCKPFSWFQRKAYYFNWLQEIFRILHQGLLVNQTSDLFLPYESDENERVFDRRRIIMQFSKL